MKHKLAVRYGESLSIIWENDEPGALNAVITISQKETGDTVLSQSGEFVNDIADLSLTASQTKIPIGLYDYMVTINYPNGYKEKYPDVDGCSECTLPTFEVCVANDEE